MATKAEEACGSVTFGGGGRGTDPPAALRVGY